MVAPRDAADVAKAIASEGTLAGQERDDNGLKMKFCWCPKGTFRMGSLPGEPGREEDEGPVNVTLSRGFWIGKNEVTQAQWSQVMGTTIQQQRYKAGSTGLYGEGPDFPMYDVNHTEAEEFARKAEPRSNACGPSPPRLGVSAADRGAVGICLSCGDDDGHGVWRPTRQCGRQLRRELPLQRSGQRSLPVENVRASAVT